jgi:hypothetical protein
VFQQVRSEVRTKCISLLSAVVVLCQIQAGFAGTVIDQFVVLVHPCPYECLGYLPTDPYPNGNYRALEDAALRQWFSAIPSLPESTFVVQVDWSAKGPSPDELHQRLIDRLGARRVCRIPFDNYYHNASTPTLLQGDYDKINQRIRQQMAAQGLTFDPATAKTAIWGQSFEGCASGYGSAIASCLGLKTPTRFDYSMSAPDAPFLLKASFLQTVAVPASDVEAYVFDLNDGRYAAFFRSALTPQWLDHRPIKLQLDPAIFSVLSKPGAAVWPQGEVPKGLQLLTLSTVQERFLIATKPHMAELLSVITGATVGIEPTSK